MDLVAAEQLGRLHVLGRARGSPVHRFRNPRGARRGTGISNPKAQVYEAYSALIASYETQYDVGSIPDGTSALLHGLCFARLIEGDGDETPKLLLTYSTEPYDIDDFHVEARGHDGSQATRLMAQDMPLGNNPDAIVGVGTRDGAAFVRVGGARVGASFWRVSDEGAKLVETFAYSNAADHWVCNDVEVSEDEWRERFDAWQESETYEFASAVEPHTSLRKTLATVADVKSMLASAGNAATQAASHAEGEAVSFAISANPASPFASVTINAEWHQDASGAWYASFYTYRGTEVQRVTDPETSDPERPSYWQEIATGAWL